MPNHNHHTIGQALPIYESRPPHWLPTASASADLGFLGFHPPRPGQDEDVLSETNVKNGFALGSQVNAETFSAQSILNIGDAALSRLEALMNEVFARRADTIPIIPSSTFRIPTRVTLNDSKRQAWFADLANPDVPLHKLGKSVPHGAKGHDLLDLLHSNNVAISRAVWFLRVFGANETAGLRNKPSYNPVQYSIDWAGVVTSYMKKQLADIALPSAPRPGLNIKQTFKGVLSDGDTRERWISRFDYCLKLLRTFYSEGLVDHRAFLTWIVQQQGTCNLAQTGFITRLADEYLDNMIDSRPLIRPLVDACLSRLSEIRATSAQDFLSNTEKLLQIIIQRLCIAMPDCFVSPKMWRAHSALLESVLSTEPATLVSRKQLASDHDISQVIRNNFNDIMRRNQALLFVNTPLQRSPRLGSAVEDVKLLNSISSSSNLNYIHFFPQSCDGVAPSFTEKLDVLLTWGVTPLQYGDHRLFAAITFIKNWRDREQARATRRDATSPNEVLQDVLFEWLDSSDTAGESRNIHSIALLFGHLIDSELFSYAKYVQRLIARGEIGLSYTEGDPESRHRRFIRWIPLSNSTSSLTLQRRTILYGTRVRATPEDNNERIVRQEVRALLPQLFADSNRSNDESLGLPSISTSDVPIPESCPTLAASPCFEQVRTVRHWLLPFLQKHISCSTTKTDQAKMLGLYSTTIEILDHVKCFQSILDTTLTLLVHSSAVEVLNAVICTLRRFATIWVCMGAVGEIVTSLDAAHQMWKTRGIQFRPLLSLLLEFDHEEHLSSASRDRIRTEISAFTMALQPIVESSGTVPDVLPEILLLVEDPDVDAPSLLANSLWIKYRKSSDWAWKVWDNTVASLRQIPAMITETTRRRTCALRYGVFLSHIDQHLALGLDAEVSRWLSGPGKLEVEALSFDAWDVFTVVLLYLSVQGALKTTTILNGLVYPIWKQASMISTEYDNSSEQLLRSANDLCHRLLVSEDINVDFMPPTSLLELQSIRTRREDAYHKSHFPLLATSVPLLICVENNQHISQELRTNSTSLRHALSLQPGFRQESHRNLEAVRDAFEQSSGLLDQHCESLSKRIIGGLRMVLFGISDDMDITDWPAATSVLSPWNLSATVIQVQLIFKRMNQSVLHGTSNETDRTNLDKLIQSLFQHSMTSDSSYLVEMVRGIDSYVVGKFINNGLKCMTDVLQQSTSSIPESEILRRVGDLFSVLIYAAEPLREGLNPLPSLDNSVQDAFLDVMQKRVASIEVSATSENNPENGHKGDTETALLLRILQFGLGFQDSWGIKTKEAIQKITSSLFQLSLTYGTSPTLSPITYPLIIDTLYFIYDEIPFDPKAISYDPFHHYPNFSPSHLPSHLPQGYRQQLCSLLPFVPKTKVSELINLPRETTTNTLQGTPVINRPWEWIENLGESTTSDVKSEQENSENERFKTKHLMKNSGSLSLEVFGAQLTGESILELGKQDGMSERREDSQAFEDSLQVETLFQRDWRESRMIADIPEGLPAGQPVNKIGFDAASPAFSYTLSRVERRPSPASSIVSRTSARGSGRQSPGQGPNSSRASKLTMSESMDAIDTTSQSPNKRKASAVPATLSDNEVEIVEGPIPSHAGPTKKAKGKALSKGKSRKR